MKKNYQKPATEVVKFQNTGMLMASQQTIEGLIATMTGTFEEEDI